MRWRAAAGALGAVVLAGAVLVLRGQVPAATPPPQPEPPRPVVMADPGLPVAEPARPPRWRVFPAQRGAIDGVVAPAHLVYTRAENGGMQLTVLGRDTGEELLRHDVPYGDAPWASLLHDGLLLIAHGGQRVLLEVLDPASGAVRELAAPPGFSFRPRLVELGEEVLVLGWQQVSPPDQPPPPASPAAGAQRSCVLAVQPRAGTARVAWCADRGWVPAWLYGGAGEVSWPAPSAQQAGCLQWWRLRPGAQVQAVPPDPQLCGARGLVELGGWRVTQWSETQVLTPVIVATDGSRRLPLGTSATFVACGRHVYWAAATQGIDPDTVYRWLPGSDHREVAFRLESPDRLAVAAPRCTDGVLSVAVTTADVSGQLVELRSLSRP
jgi:hypothetical protein